MRISDWSSDVCSSELAHRIGDAPVAVQKLHRLAAGVLDSHLVGPDIVAVGGGGLFFQIDRLDRHADRICGRPVHGLMVLYRPPILSAERLASASLRPVTATRKCQGTSPVTKVSTGRSEEHTSELQSLMRTSYAVFCLNKKNINKQQHHKI